MSEPAPRLCNTNSLLVYKVGTLDIGFGNVAFYQPLVAVVVIRI